MINFTNFKVLFENLHNNKYKFGNATIVKFNIGKQTSNVSVTPYNVYSTSKIKTTINKINKNVNKFKTDKSIKDTMRRCFNKINGTFEVDDLFITLTQKNGLISINNTAEEINEYTDKVTDYIKKVFNKEFRKNNIKVKSIINVIDFHESGILHFHVLVKFNNNIFTKECNLTQSKVLKETVLNIIKYRFNSIGLDCHLQRIYNVNGLANYLTRKQHNPKKYSNYKHIFTRILNDIKLYRTRGEVEDQKTYYLEYGKVKLILDCLYDKTNIKETFSKAYQIKDAYGNKLYNVFRFTLEFGKEYYELINQMFKDNDIRNLSNKPVV
jgi:hypothetical protein